MAELSEAGATRIDLEPLELNDFLASVLMRVEWEPAGEPTLASGAAGALSELLSPVVWSAAALLVSLLFLAAPLLWLVLAYLVRFQALAYFAVDARMARLDPALDDAAQSLGADRGRVLADVHLPLLWPGIVTAALLVFVEVMKELPATALLRPLGGDTLAIAVWEATKESRFDTAALPALLIVAVGLIPVIVLIRVSRGGDR